MHLLSNRQNYRNVTDVDRTSTWTTTSRRSDGGKGEEAWSELREKGAKAEEDKD